ncbi:1636_t:CDS:1, partial [Scutellospora calospora]
TGKARKIYALFNRIFIDRGKEMLVRIKIFSASSISKLSWEEI